jgi:cell division septation protein DedD
VVDAGTASKQALVRSLVPGAFRTFSNGRVLMQVGAFNNQAKADEMLQLVTSKGLRGTIEPIQ